MSVRVTSIAESNRLYPQPKRKAKSVKKTK
jgi:hypothetical protein